MTPTAKSELRAYTKRIKADAKARSRQFAQPSPLMELAAKYWWIPIAVWFVWLMWLVVGRHG